MRIAYVATVTVVGLLSLACRTSTTSLGSNWVALAGGEFAPPYSSRQERLEHALAGLTFTSDYVEIDAQAARSASGHDAEAFADRRCRDGQELLQRNDYVGAIAAYKEAVVAAPAFAAGYYGLGRALFAKEKPELAVVVFRTALRIDPGIADARFYLALGLEALARRQEAIAEYCRLLRIEPQHAAAYARLAIELYYSGEKDAALAAAETAARMGHPVPPQLWPLLNGRAPEPRATRTIELAIGTPVRIDAAGGTFAANETTVAASAANPQHVIAAWNDWRESSGPYEIGRVAVGLSLDGGATWSDFVIRPPTGHTGNEGDPMTAYDDLTGDLWVGGIAWGSQGGIFVARKRPGATELDAPVMAREYYFTDKCWMAAGPSPSGLGTRLYIAYNEGLIVSTDLGVSWTDPLSLGEGQGHLPRVGPDGKLFIAYWDLADGIMLKRSFDGGVSFDPAIRIASRMDVWGAGDGTRFPGTFRVPPFNYLAVDPNDGTLYCVYFDTTSIVGGNYNVDLYFTKSSDDGTTWSTPVVINGDSLVPGDQFFPWLEVDRNGRLHLLFHDTRHTVQDDGATQGWIDAYYAISADGGDNWAEHRLTAEPFDSSDDGVYGVGQFIGDYLGMAVVGKRILPAYLSTAAGDSDIYAQVIALVGNGDFDEDDDVDVADFAWFQRCFTGPAAGPLPTLCDPADLDADDAVGLIDFAELAVRLSGPG
jgi:hypothetical protein